MHILATTEGATPSFLMEEREQKDTYVPHTQQSNYERLEKEKKQTVWKLTALDKTTLSNAICRKQITQYTSFSHNRYESKQHASIYL